ncbi:MAG: PASTA domain-containing protein [Proteobacteria bacterium]|nr:MAG: PASTA domain-containing protein [Pseudomonadota bacterium]
MERRSLSHWVEILSADTVKNVTDAMISVTSKDGSGKRAALDGYVVAGKTGTAQTVDEKTKRYSQTRYISSFGGFPVGVSPKLVILAVLDEPSRPTYYASETAAPLFKEILNAAVTRYAIPSVGELQIKPLASKDNLKKRKEEAIALSQAHPEPTVPLELLGTSPQGKKVWRMPSLRGLTVQEASALFDDTRVTIRTQGAGVIEDQTPNAEQKLIEGETVSLRLGF